ncbi:MAG: hypothetical protein SOU19_00610 [Candidatus Caccosoma sp.]|nr:hypothetical protein [Candidatus Caccosoma sp.]
MNLYDNNLLINLKIKKRKYIFISLAIFILAISLATIPFFYVTQENTMLFTFFSLIPLFILGSISIYIIILVNTISSKIKFINKMLNYSYDEYEGVIIDITKTIVKRNGLEFKPYIFKNSNNNNIIFYVEDFNNIKFTNNQHLKIKLVDSYLCSYEGDTL